MHAHNNDIIHQLRKDILALQGFTPLPAGSNFNSGLGKLESAFPQQIFPVGAIHEFIWTDKEAGAATSGFIAGLLSALMRDTGGACMWISNSRKIFPPALKSFGIEPDRIIFIERLREKELCWVMEEALKCNGLAAVVGELQQLSFTASRRLQLAVEKSRVTGFIIKPHSKSLQANACVARWKVSPMPSEFAIDLPVVGYPRWKVELLKIRNGKPGVWQMEWTAGQFRHISPGIASLQPHAQKKAG